MLRASFVNQLHEALRRTGQFQPEEFRLTQSQSSPSNFSISISYLFEPAYCFEVELGFDQNGGPVGMASVSPGVLRVKESIRIQGLGGLIDGITQWTGRVHEELHAQPLQRRIDEQQAEIESLFARIDGMSDDFFTRSEAADLAARLDALEKQMTELARASGADDADLSQVITRIHDDVEILKAQSLTLKKSGWFKSATFRVVRWSTDPANRGIIKGGVELANTLLLKSGTDRQLPPAI